jgi:pyridoxal phosphate enzyme (YggS family)
MSEYSDEKINRDLELPEQKENSEELYLRLPKILERLEQRKRNETIPELKDSVRTEWLNNLPTREQLKDFAPEERHELVTREEMLLTCQAANIQLPQANPELADIAKQYGIDETNYLDVKNRFHIPKDAKKRMDPEIYEKVMGVFFKMFGKKYEGINREQVEKIFEKFDLSIRSLNMSSSIVNSEAIEQFLPEIDQKYKEDPFGVQREEHLVLDKDENGKPYYLATRKIDHGTYLAILKCVGYCIGGCKNCYRGEQTREINAFEMIPKGGKGEKKKVSFLDPVEQTRRLVERWNTENDPPHDILFSGGEPMDIKMEYWSQIVDALKDAKYLEFFRICTGDLFLGEPLRLTDKRFTDALKKFHDETGKAIKFALGLPHPDFITPESVYAIKKLQKLGLGIEFESQTPLVEGITCFQKDMQKKTNDLGKKNAADITDEELIESYAPSLAKSVDILGDLCNKFAQVASRPYKFIHDMQQSESIVYTTMAYSLLCETHTGKSDTTRPTSFAIFTPDTPNLNMSFHSFEFLKDGKRIDYATIDTDDSEETIKKIQRKINEFLPAKYQQQIKEADKKGVHKFTFPLPEGKEPDFLTDEEVAQSKIEKKVQYKLPHAVGKVATYEEPYFPGINDEEILKRLDFGDENNVFWNKLKTKVSGEYNEKFKKKRIQNKEAGTKNQETELSIPERLNQFNNEVAKVAIESGRKPEDIEVMYATKYLDYPQIAEFIKTCLDQGRKPVIGENTEQRIKGLSDYLEKNHPDLRKQTKILMIGPLQKNKVKACVEMCNEIISIDTLEIAQEVSHRAKQQNKVMPVYLQVNVSGEATKHGVKPEEIEATITSLSKLPNIQLEGLMTMVPHVSAEEVRPIFQQLKEAANKHQLKTSMGMTNDWRAAIPAGSDMIRVGRGLFKP